MSDNTNKVYRIYNGILDEWEVVSMGRYYEHYRPIWSFLKSMQCAGKCACPKEKVFVCDMSCCACPFSTQEILSLDAEINDQDGITLGEIIPYERGCDFESEHRSNVLLKELNKALNELSPYDRRICELVMQGYSGNKIAEIIGMPYNKSVMNPYYPPIISNCTNNGEIRITEDVSRTDAAGIINSNFAKIVNCVNNGTVSNPEDSKNTYGCGINDYDLLGYGYYMDNVVNEGSVINSEYNYAIGRIAKDYTFRMYYLDSSSSEAASFKNEDAKEELFAYTSDRILEDGQNLVDVLNANVDELNKAASDPEYFHWYVDSDNHLRIGDECQHTLVDYVYSKCPGCKSDGERRLQCLGCGKPFSDTEVVSAMGHIIPKEYSYVLESTCSSKGWRYKTCDVCQLVLDETFERLPLLPHTEPEEYVIGREPTCANTGFKYKVCTVCHSRIPGTTVTIPKAEHKSDGGKMIFYPTCLETGVMQYRCTECGTVLETVELLETGDHNRGPDGKCTVCGIELTNGCTCNCHKSGFIGFIWKIQRLFYKLFRTNKTCACGKLHY